MPYLDDKGYFRIDEILFSVSGESRPLPGGPFFFADISFLIKKAAGINVRSSLCRNLNYLIMYPVCNCLSMKQLC